MADMSSLRSSLHRLLCSLPIRSRWQVHPNAGPFEEHIGDGKGKSEVGWFAFAPHPNHHTRAMFCSATGSFFSEPGQRRHARLTHRGNTVCCGRCWCFQCLHTSRQHTLQSAPPATYTHLASFLRGAPSEQVHTLWQRVGMELEARLVAQGARDIPTWTSTSGLGVSWLHVRLDSRPKYYQYRPFKQA